MAVTVTTQSDYIIDGDELNAGERAFVRNTRLYMIDGAEAGTASERQFLRDISIRVIGGRVGSTFPGMFVNSHNFHIVHGRCAPGHVNVMRADIFGIDGLCHPDIVATRSHSAYIVDME